MRSRTQFLLTFFITATMFITYGNLMGNAAPATTLIDKSAAVQFLIKEQVLKKCADLFTQNLEDFENRNKVAFEIKSDGSLVSNLEQEVERVIGNYLKQVTPWAGFQGEEGFNFMASQGPSDYKWYLDPIDGTISFRNGLDTFAFTLTLVKGDSAIATIIKFPRLERVYTAYSGQGVRLNDKPIKIGNALKNEKGIFALSDNYTFSMTNRETVLKELHQLPYVVRNITDIYGYCMVAEGKCVAKFDAAGALWDLWPGHLLIEEAGGKCYFFPLKNPTEDLAGSMLIGDPAIVDKIYHTLKEKIADTALHNPYTKPFLAVP